MEVRRSVMMTAQGLGLASQVERKGKQNRGAIAGVGSCVATIIERPGGRGGW